LSNTKKIGGRDVKSILYSVKLGVLKKLVPAKPDMKEYLKNVIVIQIEIVHDLNEAYEQRLIETILSYKSCSDVRIPPMNEEQTLQKAKF
jgi:hypothetical protein